MTPIEPEEMKSCITKCAAAMSVRRCIDLIDPAEVTELPR